MTPGIDTDFEVLAFFPVDHGVAVEGKVYVNGGFWNQFNVPTFPYAVPPMGLVAVVSVPFRAYHQDHTFGFGMEDADGNAMPLEVEGSFRVGADPNMRTGDPTLMPITVGIGGLTIDKPGDYAFTFAVDKTPLARYVVRAAQVAAPMAFPPAAPGPPPS